MLLICRLESRAPVGQAMIPHHSAKIGFQIRHHFAHGLQKSVDGVRGLATRVGQASDGEKRAVKIVVTIDEKKAHESKVCRLLQGFQRVQGSMQLDAGHYVSTFRPLNVFSRIFAPLILLAPDICIHAHSADSEGG